MILVGAIMEAKNKVGGNIPLFCFVYEFEAQQHQNTKWKDGS